MIYTFVQLNIANAHSLRYELSDWMHRFAMYEGEDRLHHHSGKGWEIKVNTLNNFKYYSVQASVVVSISDPLIETMFVLRFVDSNFSVSEKNDY